jgi:hypothetical protein
VSNNKRIDVIKGVLDKAVSEGRLGTTLNPTEQCGDCDGNCVQFSKKDDGQNHLHRYECNTQHHNYAC